MLKKILLGLGGLILGLVLFILVKTISFTAETFSVEPVTPVEIPDIATERFQQSLTFKTVSFLNEEDRDTAEFRWFHEFLASSYPLIDSVLPKKFFNQSVMYEWAGRDTGKKGVVVMGHFDVVPVDSSTMDKWNAPPFSGELIDGIIYGRGAMDDKINVIAWLEAAEILINEGYQPERTIYMAFGHDEEVGGENGAKLIAKYLEDQGKDISFAIDEGGYIASGDFVEGLKGTMAVINTGEKGYVSYRLTISTPGGHSSSPPPDNTIASLARAIVALEDNQFEYMSTPAIDAQNAIVGPHLDDFTAKMAMANTWLFGNEILKAMNAHTTTAPTMLSGGVKDNVIPTEASVVVNFRIMPGQNSQDVYDHIVATINDDRIRVEALNDANEPTPVSDHNSESYKLIQQTILELFPETIVTPGLLGGGTDSKHFIGVADNVYRFYPTRITPENASVFHGNNEHISVSNYHETIQFNYQLVKNLEQLNQ